MTSIATTAQPEHVSGTRRPRERLGALPGAVICGAVVGVIQAMSPLGFWWLEPNDADNNVFAFARRTTDSEDVVVFVANLSPVPRTGYRLGLPRSGRWRELVNTDSGYYGGSDVGNLGGAEAGPIAWQGQPFSAEINLPPLGALWLVPDAG